MVSGKLCSLLYEPICSQYIANWCRQIEDPSTGDEERKCLRGRLLYHEECIETCRHALLKIEAQQKLLIMEKNGTSYRHGNPSYFLLLLGLRLAVVSEVTSPPLEVATVAVPTSSASLLCKLIKLLELMSCLKSH